MIIWIDHPRDQLLINVICLFCWVIQTLSILSSCLHIYVVLSDIIYFWKCLVSVYNTMISGISLYSGTIFYISLLQTHWIYLYNLHGLIFFQTDHQTGFMHFLVVLIGSFCYHIDRNVTRFPTLKRCQFTSAQSLKQLRSLGQKFGFAT